MSRVASDHPGAGERVLRLRLPPLCHPTASIAAGPPRSRRIGRVPRHGCGTPASNSPCSDRLSPPDNAHELGVSSPLRSPDFPPPNRRRRVAPLVGPPLMAAVLLYELGSSMSHPPAFPRRPWPPASSAAVSSRPLAPPL